MSTSDAGSYRIRLRPDQRRTIEQLAERDQISVEDVILRAVDQVLAALPGDSQYPAGTPFHGLDHLLDEVGDGPEDLSTNKAYLDDIGS